MIDFEDCDRYLAEWVEGQSKAEGFEPVRKLAHLAAQTGDREAAREALEFLHEMRQIAERCRRVEGAALDRMIRRAERTHERATGVVIDFGTL